jgi:hypothetical protein
MAPQPPRKARSTLPFGPVVIRPSVAMYSAFSRLNYKPWFALAEFLDNAIQSYVVHRDRLHSKKSPKPHLTISIRIDDERIKISDDAAGIGQKDFARAFAPAQRPPDTSGLSEFGLGMKAAACWFSRRWSVTTSAFGEPVERRVAFDVPKIVQEEIEELTVEEHPASEADHYTHVVLEDLLMKPKGRAVSKIKSHLASIYRRFLADGSIAILYNDEALSHREPEVLKAPLFSDPHGAAKEWRKRIEIQLDKQRKVSGSQGLRMGGTAGKGERW